jgi:hypothetical protein
LVRLSIAIDRGVLDVAQKGLRTAWTLPERAAQLRFRFAIEPISHQRVDPGQHGGAQSGVACSRTKKIRGTSVGDINQFVAMPFDLTKDGLVAGEPSKCATPGSAIERAKGYWQVLGHAGAVAFIRSCYPEVHVTVLRTFGSVPDCLPE